MKKSKIILSVFLVIQIIALKIVSFFPEFIEENQFNRLPGFDENYYKDYLFTPRKVSELFGK